MPYYESKTLQYLIYQHHIIYSQIANYANDSLQIESIMGMKNESEKNQREKEK